MGKPVVFVPKLRKERDKEKSPKVPSRAADAPPAEVRRGLSFSMPMNILGRKE